MPQSRTNFDEMLKEVYGVGLRNAINNTSIVLKEAQKRADKTDFQGREAVWAVHLRRSSSTGSLAELGTLPTPDRQGYDNARQRVSTIAHTIKLSREVIASSRSSAGAFQSAMTAESQGAETDLKNDVGRQVFGIGRQQADTTTTLRTGVIANVAGAPAGAVITLDQLVAGTAESLTEGEMRFFFIGMLVDAIDPADGSLESAAAGMEITAIDFDARTITVNDATGVSDNDWIVRHGSYNNEFPGLRVLIATAAQDQPNGSNTVAVHGLSSATYPAWASVGVGSTTTPVSDDLFMEAYDKSMTDGAGTMPNIIVGPYSQQRALASSLQAQRRYDGREVAQAGWTGLQVARGTYIADRYAPDRDAFIVDFSNLLYFLLEDFQWDEEDGMVFFKTTTQLAYEARFFGMISLGAALRNSSVRVRMQLP